MDMAIQLLTGLVGAALLGLGAKTIAAPKSMLDNFSIEPDGAAGLNTVRGVIGGLFLGCVALMATGFATGETQWFLAVAFVLASVAVGRLLGLLLDGFEKAVVPPLVVEVVMVTVLVSAHVFGG